MAKLWKPRKYQKRGLDDVLGAFDKSGRGQLLLWDAGMGKTSTTLAAISQLIDDGRIGEGPRGASMAALVTAPLRVAQGVWAQEAAKWSQFEDLTVQLVWHPSKARKETNADTPADVYVINHESLAWLLQHWQGWVPDVVVVDEAAKFKNGQSRRFQALKSVRKYTKAIYGLTATPQPNNEQDLWSQAFMVDGGKALGPYITHFRRRWMHDVGHGYPDWRLRAGAKQEIYDALAPIASRLEISGNLDLPSLTVVDVPIRLPDAALGTYRKFERDLTAKLDGGQISAVHAASATMKLRQIANGCVYLSDDGSPSRSVEMIHEAKVDATADLLEEISGPVMVVYEFEHDVAGIEKAIGQSRPGAQVERIGSKGATTEKRVNQILQWWNGGAHGNGVLILHPLSGGEGLNLQEGGHHMIQYGLTWRLDGHIQTIARIWRQGQEKPVIVHRLVAVDTVDEDVVAALERKDASQKDLLDALKERTSQ